MRILLIKPSPDLATIRSVHGMVFLEPLELGYIAASVPAGHDVQALDLRLARRPDRQFRRKLEAYRPDIVGISGYTHEIEQVKRLARQVRQSLPEAIVVVGGHHATVLPDQYDMDCFDAIVSGEGTAPFRAIVEAAAKRRPFKGIPNVYVPGDGFGGDGQIPPRYPELDTIPSPRRDLWDYRRYSCFWTSEAHPNWARLYPPVSMLRTSFGCHMECSFCVVPRMCGRQHMGRDTKQIVEELRTLPTEHVYFCDDETFIDPDHAERVAVAIREAGIEKRYYAWARSTTVNRHPELFKLWRGIGLDTVFLGFESCTDEDLQDVNKHATVADNERAHETLRAMQIAVHAGFMVQPWFTAEDFKRLETYIRRMPPAQISVTVCTPSPGSPAWETAATEFIVDPYPLCDSMHPLTRATMPLREFYRHFGVLQRMNSTRNPIRTQRSLCRPWELVRIQWSVHRYSRAMANAYRDFPEELW